MKNLILKFKNFYIKNEKWAPLSFFIAGFLLDILTVSKIDDTLGILQQVVYIFTIGLIFILEFKKYTPQTNIASKIWEFHDELHKRNITLKYKLSEAELEIEKILKKYKKV